MFFMMSAACLGVIMVIVLTLRQLFFGLKRDTRSKLELPPRAVICNGAIPIAGHTGLIRNNGNNEAYKRFNNEMKAISILPKKYSTMIGECFAIFVWAQWRVFIHGPERSKRVFKKGRLKPSWAYFIPTPLLGTSCPALLNQEDKELILELLERPMSQEHVIKMAPSFALIAENFVDKLLNGELHNANDVGLNGVKRTMKHHQRGDRPLYPQKEEFSITPQSLKEFTLHLINGPILGLNLWNNEKNNLNQTQSKTESDVSVDNKQNDESSEKSSGEEDFPREEKLLLWINRLQRGLLGFRFTAGKAWMQIWRCNEYGRAINARGHLLNDILLHHVSTESEKVDTKREQGELIKDPLTTAMPLCGLACEVSRGYYSDSGISRIPIIEQLSSETVDSSSNDISSPPLHSLAFLRQQSLISKKRVMKSLDSPQKILRRRTFSEPDIFADSNDGKIINPYLISSSSPSLLFEILDETDEDNIGLKEAAVAEICMHLWSMLDASSSWTASVLYILQNDPNTFGAIRNELDEILGIYGWRALFSPKAMSDMYYLDAIIYEAIRLCPQFCGGLWQTTRTVDLLKDGLQIPARTHILFSDTSSHAFDLESVWGKSPHDLGKTYPNQELYGFLPLSGLEVPLMVLQTKVLLVTIILRCDIIAEDTKGDVDIKHNDKSSHSPTKEASHTLNDYQPYHSNKNLDEGGDEDDLSYEKSQCDLESKLSVDDIGSLSPPSLGPSFSSGHQVSNVTLLPDTCKNWFSKKSFPEPLNDIGITKRKEEGVPL